MRRPPHEGQNLLEGFAFSPLTGECNQAVVPAGVAMNTQESMSEHAALEVGAELALDEARRGCTIAAGSGEEGLELLPDDFVKESLLGLVAFVLDGEGSVGTGAKRRGE